MCFGWLVAQSSASHFPVITQRRGDYQLAQPYSMPKVDAFGPAPGLLIFGARL